MCAYLAEAATDPGKQGDEALICSANSVKLEDFFKILYLLK